jgi:hypothetical protein
MFTMFVPMVIVAMLLLPAMYIGRRRVAAALLVLSFVSIPLTCHMALGYAGFSDGQRTELLGPVRMIAESSFIAAPLLVVLTFQEVFRLMSDRRTTRKA